MGTASPGLPRACICALLILLLPSLALPVYQVSSKPPLGSLPCFPQLEGISTQGFFLNDSDHSDQLESYFMPF